MKQDNPISKQHRGRRSIAFGVAGIFITLITGGIIFLFVDPKSAAPSQLVIAGVAFVTIPVLLLLLLKRFAGRLFQRRVLFRAAFCLAFIATFIAIFYSIENWRGKKAWQKRKQEMESKGQTVNWDAYIPREVPNEQNVFKAPKMADWFVRGAVADGPRFTKIDLSIPAAVTIAEITAVPWDTNVVGENNAVVWEYDFPQLRMGKFGQPDTKRLAFPEVFPLVTFEDAPLSEIIRNLTRIAKLRYEIDTTLPARNASMHFESVTAEQALLAFLDKQGLKFVPNAQTGVGRITKKKSPGDRVLMDAAISNAISALVQTSFQEMSSAPRGQSLEARQTFTLVAMPVKSIKPLRIHLRSAITPTLMEMQQVIEQATHGQKLNGFLSVQSTGTNSFRICVENSDIIAAEDYLAYTDQFRDEFKLIRDALQRPYARIDGDYERPFAGPIVNFVTVRVIAQITTQRAQSYLLLRQPEHAVAELTFLHELSKFLGPNTDSEGVYLVNAMINVALAGLYTSAVEDGLRLHIWEEPQLLQLQEQLESMHLFPLLAQSFKSEIAATARSFETATGKDLTGMISQTRDHWKKFRDPNFWFFNVGPRGWLYQNMALAATIEQKVIDGLSQEPFVPGFLDRAMADAESPFRHPSPYNCIARIAIPNFNKAIQTAARNEITVRQALIVCALERYHLANHQFPQTLDALCPTFLDKAPVDLIGGKPFIYHRTDDDRFVLYSIGWNNKDDGGVIDKEMTKGDWVWKGALN